MSSGTDDKNLTEVTENMSELNPDVIAQQNQNAVAETASPAAQTPIKGKTDSKGRAFDPSRHQVNDDGSPRINRDGYIAGKPGRPDKQEKPAGTSGPGPQAQPTTEKKSVNQDHAMAKLTTNLFFKLGISAFGDEWMPRVYTVPQAGITINEQDEIMNAFDQYFRSKNIQDLTPGWALVLSLGSFASARMIQPKTQGRLKVMAGRALHFGARIFAKGVDFTKKIFKGAKRASQLNPRNDGERQDNPSPENSEAVPS